MSAPTVPTLPPGTPLGIEGHVPTVPRAAGSPPSCSCGHRWDPRDPDSELVGVHIQRVAAERGVPINVPGRLV